MKSVGALLLAAAAALVSCCSGFSANSNVCIGTTQQHHPHPPPAPPADADEIDDTKKGILATLGRTRGDQLNQFPEGREYCTGCNRPPIQCLCSHLPSTKISLQTQVLVLQHPVEFRRKTVSTTPLVKLVLDSCQVLVGRSFDVQQLGSIIDDACSQGKIPLLLFPGPDAITLEDPGAMVQLHLHGQQQLREKQQQNQTQNQKLQDTNHNMDMDMNDSNTTMNSTYLLIIVDGTWTQAKRMVRYSPILLQRCQPIQFMGTSQTSIYDSIRKQPDAYCLSTLESCARTLQLLEPHNPQMERATRYLYTALKALVRTQMQQERIHLEENPGSIRNSTKMELKKRRQMEQELDIEVGEAAADAAADADDDDDDDDDDDANKIGIELSMSKEQQQQPTSSTGGDDVKDANKIGIELSKDQQQQQQLPTKDRDCLPDGYVLRCLAPSDTEFVNSRWPFRSPKSLRMIERQISADNVNATRTGSGCCCLGIEYEKDGALVACILRHKGGSLGILHVDEEHRRRGFGELLLDRATKALLHRGVPTFAFIFDGNHQSEALFTKLGWVKADTLAKKGTG